MGPKLTADIEKNMNVEIVGLGNSTYNRGAVTTVSDFSIIVSNNENNNKTLLTGVKVSSSKNGTLLVTDRRNKHYMINIIR